MRRKLSDNLKRVRDRIAAACERAHRDPQTVTLLAVTKYVEVDIIRQLLDLGVTEIGESRVQELTRRAAMIEEFRSRRRQLEPGASAPGPSPNWHMIGHLQRNKVKAVLPWARIIHSVDTLRLAEEISRHSEKMNRTTDVFVQVNVSEEKSKHGLVVGAAAYLTEQIASMPNIRCIGLMTMAPLTDDPETARPSFTRLRELFEDIRDDRRAGPQFQHLSMGMSQDFEQAVEEGATIVRIGSALFEGLAPSTTA
jgi:pyridoxal phosphate enzyme (YggS family)